MPPDRQGSSSLFSSPSSLFPLASSLSSSLLSSPSSLLSLSSFPDLLLAGSSSSSSSSFLSSSSPLSSSSSPLSSSSSSSATCMSGLLRKAGSVDSSTSPNPAGVAVVYQFSSIATREAGTSGMPPSRSRFAA